MTALDSTRPSNARQFSRGLLTRLLGDERGAFEGKFVVGRARRGHCALGADRSAARAINFAGNGCVLRCCCLHAFEICLCKSRVLFDQLEGALGVGGVKFEHRKARIDSAQRLVAHRELSLKIFAVERDQRVARGNRRAFAIVGMHTDHRRGDARGNISNVDRARLSKRAKMSANRLLNRSRHLQAQATGHRRITR